ncbi:MAG: DUF1045 domain-containing protein [Rhodocyclaceae bacterium]|nr:DUF1045 domain-containing protein [Rhodocyclaceae bacterium]
MTEPAPRFALYWAPEAGTPLDRLGSTWLGRDARTGALLRQPMVPGVSSSVIREITASPRRYGLHATLRAPFRLAPGCDPARLERSIQSLASVQRPFVTRLAVGELRDFVALLPLNGHGALTALERDCVEAMAGLAQAPGAEERARRLAGGLNDRQKALLEAHGYPFVLDEFRFHLSLCGRIQGALRERVGGWLAEALSAARVDEVEVAALGLFVEAAPGAPLRHVARFGFDGSVLRFGA